MTCMLGSSASERTHRVQREIPRHRFENARFTLRLLVLHKLKINLDLPLLLHFISYKFISWEIADWRCCSGQNCG